MKLGQLIEYNLRNHEKNLLEAVPDPYFYLTKSFFKKEIEVWN